MRIKLPIAILAILLSHQIVCSQNKDKDKLILGNYTIDKLLRKRDPNSVLDFSVWPIFYGGGTFFFNEIEIVQHYPGYSLSGGLTFNIYDSGIFFFTDALYSYRAYDGYPENIHYRIQENTADLAIGAGLEIFYIGAYAQFPISAKIRVSEWTLDDFDGLSRNPSFSLIGGIRVTGKYLGIDARLLLGQGPGQFLSRAFGESWLGQISIGIMGGF
ncbi:MAG: hypothetical protein LBU89_02540 [Fibromonadaceae bacterium]|jgi:hypothetical protein|nr:hypothetical protein [Fibromonadaceae bacterium]